MLRTAIISVVHNCTRKLCATRYFHDWNKHELSYRKQIACQLRTQYVEGILRPKYYTV